MKAINYDEVAGNYDERFKAYKQDGIALRLQELAREIDAEAILELGCGTGHWLDVLHDSRKVFGIDRSSGMLKKAVERHGNYFLINGDIDSLPFKDNTFDMIFCVNALHHFPNPSETILEVRKLLKQGGALTIINMDPHAREDQWFIYDYFPSTYETDLNAIHRRQPLRNG
jgi:ubiquinone/menaquinone biosynthesis C-methylase UbiE